MTTASAAAARWFLCVYLLTAAAAVCSPLEVQVPHTVVLRDGQGLKRAVERPAREGATLELQKHRAVVEPYAGHLGGVVGWWGGGEVGWWGAGWWGCGVVGWWDGGVMRCSGWVTGLAMEATCC